MATSQVIEREITVLVPFHYAAGADTQTVTVKQSLQNTAYLSVDDFAASIAALVKEELLRSETGQYVLTVKLK